MRASRLMEEELLPLLRKQKGFLEELVLVSPDRKEAVVLSLWEEREQAEKCDREVNPQALKTLGKYFEGTPAVKIFEVEYATFHKYAVVATF